MRRFASVDEYVNENCSESYTKAQNSFKEKLETILYHTYTSIVVFTMLKGVVGEVEGVLAAIDKRISKLSASLETEKKKCIRNSCSFSIDLVYMANKVLWKQLLKIQGKSRIILGVAFCKDQSNYFAI